MVPATLPLELKGTATGMTALYGIGNSIRGTKPEKHNCAFATFASKAPRYPETAKV
jgi:hypothetical protein